MKALQIIGPGQAQIVEVARPEPAAGEVLVQVHGVASCPHWDITLMSGKDIFERPGYPEYPLPPGREGHELCGAVAALGEGVTQFEIGQRVAAWRCIQGGLWGGFAEYVVMPAINLLATPDSLADEDVAPLELAMCVAVSFMAMPSIAGLRLGVGGLGGAGLMAVQYARAAGAAEVIGFDLAPGRRELALQLGADRCVDPTSSDGAAMHADPRGAHVDASIDCSGVKASVQCQMDLAARWVSLFGVAHETYDYTLRHRGLSLLGYGSHNADAAAYAMERMLDGRLQLSPTITAELPLSRFAEGTEMLRRQEAIRILYRPAE